MEDRETARMRKYGESKTTQIMMATVPHVTSVLRLRKFRADGFLLTRVYMEHLKLGFLISLQKYFIPLVIMICLTELQDFTQVVCQSLA